MQVIFLEIALSYLALAQDQPSFTHADSVSSWADLLNTGYRALIFDDVPTMHALALGVGLVAVVALMALAVWPRGEGPMTALVSLDGLTIRAPTRHLIRDVSLEVHPKEVTALVGPSGAGKSLTARAVMCVLDVSPGLESGSLRYPALDPDKDWYSGVRGEGMRAQKRLLEETRPLRGAVLHLLAAGGDLGAEPGTDHRPPAELAIGRRDAPPADVGAEIREILGQVGLDPRVSAALPGELSGGMCQRAALAIAVAPKPRLVIADEPETGSTRCSGGPSSSCWSRSARTTAPACC